MFSFSNKECNKLKPVIFAQIFLLYLTAVTYNVWNVSEIPFLKSKLEPICFSDVALMKCAFFLLRTSVQHYEISKLGTSISNVGSADKVMFPSQKDSTSHSRLLSIVIVIVLNIKKTNITFCFFILQISIQTIFRIDFGPVYFCYHSSFPFLVRKLVSNESLPSEPSYDWQKNLNVLGYLCCPEGSQHLDYKHFCLSGKHGFGTGSSRNCAQMDKLLPKRFSRDLEKCCMFQTIFMNNG
ncbi:hypothetical protein EGR_01698 [Echinococcus granulosus]|uniref:Uncharacterized protein n=1 Tax=Echinococcus granulosus TaxID=6210 RepID=W6USK1_ECHGR|nr:hypothetical protein EGR_01698 [Echinococcus granulosus]EUB63616.1 hypothetical protein EGR_01698 [Echinococcus granulosus]